MIHIYTIEIVYTQFQNWLQSYSNEHNVLLAYV